MTALLEGCDLGVWRGDTLLFEGLQLSLAAGELLQIQGTNGAGKTTLLRILAGLLPPEEGEVLWRGQPLRRVTDDFHSELLFIGHRSGIVPALTAVENLDIACRLSGADRCALPAALDEVALGEQSHLPCRALSAGQQRRVALARLMLQPAQLWILDEPLTALDIDGRAWVAERIDRQCARGGGVILTTHQTLPLGNRNVQALRLG